MSQSLLQVLHTRRPGCRSVRMSLPSTLSFGRGRSKQSAKSSMLLALVMIACVDLPAGVGDLPPIPIGMMPVLSMQAGQEASLDLTAYFLSPDGDPLTFVAETSDEAVAAASLTGSTLTITAVGVGNATITAAAFESTGMFAYQHLTVQANPGGTTSANDPFNIAVHFASDVSTHDQVIIRSAAARWDRVLAKTVLEDVSVKAGEDVCPSSSWGTWQQDTSVDDLLVLVSYDSIDGDGDDEGNTLARAGACVWRNADQDWLPVVGKVVIDEADPLSEHSLQEAEDLIAHEIGHVLGIGWFWDWVGLLQEASDTTESRDTYFSGRRARQAFDHLGGEAYTGNKVPVHNLGRLGSINGHWRESVMQGELMTPYMDSGRDPLSLITLWSLEDLGWRGDYNAVDAYRVPQSAANADEEDARLLFDEVVVPEVLMIVGEDGRLHPVSRR